MYFVNGMYFSNFWELLRTENSAFLGQCKHNDDHDVNCLPPSRPSRLPVGAICIPGTLKAKMCERNVLLFLSLAPRKVKREGPNPPCQLHLAYSLGLQDTVDPDGNHVLKLINRGLPWWSSGKEGCQKTIVHYSKRAKFYGIHQKNLMLKRSAVP